MLEVFGAPRQRLAAVRAATHLVVVRGAYRAGWPPVHDWAGRGVAAVLARDLASAGEFIGAVCTALFGPVDDEIRYGRRDDAMEAAIATARGALPEARARFLADRLPPRAHLMVKYGLHRDGRTEYVWATVTSWTDPDTVVGTSTNDAQLDPSVRVGRLVRIVAAEVIDWAYWIDGEGVVEGGWTTEVLTR